MGLIENYDSVTFPTQSGQSAANVLRFTSDSRKTTVFNMACFNKSVYDLCLIACLVQLTNVYAQMEGFVYGGNFPTISKFPHVAYIAGRCSNASYWMCGSTVLNQKVLLTAAHCISPCVLINDEHHDMSVLLGNEDLKKVTIKRKVHRLLKHGYYNDVTVENDIGLIAVQRSMPLGDHVKRVVTSPRFPTFGYEGFVAGWGLSGDINNVLLKSVYQKLRSVSTCAQVGDLHPGMFCASDPKHSYPAEGDSGSALVTVKGYIQIGIVSFKIDELPELLVYTNVTYYYKWIKKNTERLFCGR